MYRTKMAVKRNDICDKIAREMTFDSHGVLSGGTVCNMAGKTQENRKWRVIFRKMAENTKVSAGYTQEKGGIYSGKWWEN